MARVCASVAAGFAAMRGEESSATIPAATMWAAGTTTGATGATIITTYTGDGWVIENA